MTAEQVTLVPTENISAGSKSSAKPVGKLQRPPTRLDWKANFSFESSLLHRPDLRTNIASSITDLIGWTPIVMLNKVTAGLPGRVAVKLEAMNPYSSVKDRTALSLIEELERQGKITPGKSKLLEITSGNTGIGLAFIAAARGYELTVSMPAPYSDERKAILNILGAKLYLTAKEDGPAGMLALSDQLEQEDPELVTTVQFEAAANPGIHYITTGPEIWSQTQGKIDFLVCGSGTGGTITGAGTYLKEQKPDVQVVVVEPTESTWFTTGTGGPHPIQGISPAMHVPTMDQSILDGIVTVPSEDCLKMCHRLAREEGLFLGPSSGAAILGAVQLASKPENEGKLIIAVAPSFGERYMSTEPYVGNMKAVKELPVKLLSEEEKPAAMAAMQRFIDRTKPLEGTKVQDADAAALSVTALAEKLPEEKKSA